MEIFNFKKRFSLRNAIALALIVPSFQAVAVQIPDGVNLVPYLVASGTYDLQGNVTVDSVPLISSTSGGQVFNGGPGGSEINFASGTYLNPSTGSTWTFNNVSLINGSDLSSAAGVIRNDATFEINGSSVRFINNASGIGPAGGGGGAVRQAILGQGALKLNADEMYFQGNTALGSGGAVWGANEVLVNGSIYLIDNSSGRYGGGLRGLAFGASGGNEVVVTGNKATLGGGRYKRKWLFYI